METQKMKAFAIKINDTYALTVQEIQDIPVERVFEWVKTGAWSVRDFRKWLQAIRIID